MRKFFEKIKHFFGFDKAEKRRVDTETSYDKDDNWENEEELYGFARKWLSEFLKVDLKKCGAFVESAVFPDGIELEHNKPVIFYRSLYSMFMVIIPQKDAVTLKDEEQVNLYLENADWYAGWFKRGRDMLWYNFFQKMSLEEIQNFFKLQINEPDASFGYECLIPLKTAAKFQVMQEICHHFKEKYPNLIPVMAQVSVGGANSIYDVHVFPRENDIELLNVDESYHVDLAITNQLAVYLQYHPEKMHEVAIKAHWVYHNFTGPEFPFVEKGQVAMTYEGDDPMEFWNKNCPILMEKWTHHLIDAE